MATDEMATEQNWDTDQEVDTPMYAIRDVPGKGKGLITTKPIPKGTRILAEAPVFTNPMVLEIPNVKADVVRQVNNLTPAQKTAYFDLTCLDMFYNCLKGPAENIHGLYLIASRVNHACLNNAHDSWNANLGKLTLHALKDIAKELAEFTCTCSLCSLEGQRLKDSDERLTQSWYLYELLRTQSEATEESAWRGCRAIRECAGLLAMEDVFDHYSIRLYSNACFSLMAMNERARQMVLLKRHHQACLLFLGDDNPKTLGSQQTLQGLAQLNSVIGQTNSATVPEGLDLEAFEDWLWRNGKACLNGFADPSNEAVFPRLGGLPISPRNSLDYFTFTSDGRRLQPRKAWCLLAEITRTGSIPGGVRFWIQDYYHNQCPIEFKSGGQNSGALSPEPQVGWAIAILRPVRKGYLAEDLVLGRYLGYMVCVREREKDLIKIFPISLNDLMSLSARVLDQARRRNENMPCLPTSGSLTEGMY
ncbi:hypothetical protein LCI18_002235 [Fusarium solani-melongenae]|uniref:Uncharacterized protein n=1 Tax=Fusarium solani subsp. cucurbitae TaxID=2747967 RepID=A0ACD3YQY6_FUSSC|nr:hypothetical protein LCI18_002235 [Fusarium solani-melongenae]